MTKRRGARPGWSISDAGRCQCGKIRYLSRKDARQVARSLSRAGLNAYECAGYWHLGHLPPIVRRGRATREDL